MKNIEPNDDDKKYSVSEHTESQSPCEHPEVHVSSNVGGWPEGDVQVDLKVAFPKQEGTIQAAHTGLLCEHVLRKVLCGHLDQLVQVLATTLKQMQTDQSEYAKAMDDKDWGSAMAVLMSLGNSYGVDTPQVNPITGKPFDMLGMENFIQNNNDNNESTDAAGADTRNPFDRN